MAAATRTKRSKRYREFVIRLDSPGLYDKLFKESVKRSQKEGRRVPMTELVRVAVEEYLRKPYPPPEE